MLALGLLGLRPADAQAQDRALQELDRALAVWAEGSGAEGAGASGASAAASSALIKSLAELERRDAARRREFGAAAARKLPPKAAERLARTREAYEAGHGRLIGILRRIARHPAVAPPDPAAVPGAVDLAELASLAREARQVVARLLEASRREPTSAEVRVRAPTLVPPALGQTTGALTTGPIGAVPQVLKDAASALPGPVEVYEWVRNNVRPEFYYGEMKGAVQTYLEQSGNDADTAALLVQMLRSKGIPARFARGTVEVSGSTLMALTGTLSAEQAVRVLERAGIPHETVLGAGGVASVKMERVWAEAYVPYVNYRGAILDTQGKFWIPPDPGFKRLQPPAGLDVARELGLDARALLDEYLLEVRRETPLEFLRVRVGELLSQQRPGLAFADVLNRRAHESQTLGILPSSLPYKVASVTEVSYDVPEPLRHALSVVAESEGTTLLEATLPVADLLGRRLTLAYVPASAEDEEVARSYGGIQRTPPYLIEVTPVLKSGGVAVAAGTAGVGLGVRVRLRIDVRTPGGTSTITNTVLAGNLTAIGLGGRRVTGEEVRADRAAEILSARALSYLDRWNRSDEELADLLRVVPVRPTVSACLVMSAIEVDYAGGDPLFPVSFEWKGIAIDADLRSTAPVGLEGREAERRFVLLSGLEGSILENRIFEDDLGIESVSTAKALQLARAQGIAIHDLTRANVDDVLPGLTLDLAVKAEVREATERGLLVRVPAAPVSHLAWSGVGYLILDEETGEAAYQLQGGHSGGVTAPAVIVIPDSIRDALVDQGEEPAPEGSDVARIQKFDSTDFQQGTVDKAVPKALRVLVTDAEGFRVPRARVVFTVIGGGGRLVDPVTGRESDEEVMVLSNDRGEAEVRLVLGKRTDLIPRFVQFEGDEFAEQVGLNLVGARSGRATLAEPFTAIGFPDDHFDGTFRYAKTFSHLGDTDIGAIPNLRVAARIGVAVGDQHGNPLSNFRVLFQFRPDPVPVEPPPGTSRLRPANTTPGFVLSPDNWGACLARSPNPLWGECVPDNGVTPGELPEVVVRSSSQGTFAFAVIGDSPYSLYYYDIGTVLTPAFLWIAYGTEGWICRNPDPTRCLGRERPRPASVSHGGRPVRANRFGNLIEAYPPEGEGEVVLWADVFFEEERIEEVRDSGGNVHFRAFGENRWKRERLMDSEFRLTPATPGTGVAPAVAAADATGAYRARMTMSSTPQLNTVRFDARHTPPEIPYLPDDSDDVDPAYIFEQDGVKRVRRVPDPARPWLGSGTFSLWGARPVLTEIDPTPVLVSPSETVAKPSLVRHRIEPEEFRQLLEPTQVLFELKRAGQTVAAANGAEGDFLIPQGLPFPPAPHTAHLSVLGVNPESGPLAGRLASVPLEVPGCPLLTLVTKQVLLDLTRDPLDETVCGEEGKLHFVLCRPSLVTLLVDGRVVTAVVDPRDPRPGEPPPVGVPVPVSDVPLAAGPHVLVLSPDLLGTSLTRAPFLLRAVELTDPDLTQQEDGEVVTRILNRSVLAVGHAFVKGVDLLLGHGVRQATDLKLPGRHLGLEVTRTYSSAGSSAAGEMGAGWAWNYASLLTETRCGQVVVTTADGSSQVFRTRDGGLTFTPQKGYHTKLVRNADLSYDFIDKSGTRHRFRQPEDPARPQGPRRLEYIEEPHGDRIVLSYDSGNRLVRVTEVHPEAGEVRALEIAYRQAGGFERVARVAVPALGLAVDYEHDSFGNLVKVTRSGASLPAAGNDASPRVETYEYSTTNVRDRHQMLAAVDPNGSRTEYRYFAAADPFPGEDSGLVFASKEEFVKAVLEFPGAAPLTTEFRYDYSQAVSTLTFRTTVRDPRGNDTLYVLNGNGSPLRIEEPLGRTTAAEWATDDIFKTKETDPLGRVTDYGYDERANLTSERITTADFGVVETTYAYDPRFNKLTFKRDAEGRETRYEIDPATGDLVMMTDAAGNVTRYEYDTFGRLTRVTDPRGHSTVYADHDSFGNPRTVTDPLGNVTSRAYDLRGRLTRQTDTWGRETRTAYDGLDRPVEVVRVAGGDSDDDVTRTAYYPGGQVRSVTNAKGAVTTYALDGLNRVVATETDLGAEVLRTSTEYDGNGNRTMETDRRGVRRRMTYDALNRLVRVEVVAGLSGEGPMGEVATFAYDLVGNKLSETDVAGLRTEFEYDGLYRVKKKLLPESGPSGRYFEAYGYDRVGNRLSLTDPNGNITTFAYDGLNRLERTVNALGQETTIAYDDPEGSHVNRSEEHDQTRGLRTSYRYDKLSREVERTVSLEGEDGDPTNPVTVYTTTTAYDDAAHALTVTDPRGTPTRTRLDGLDRVVEQIVDPEGLTLTTLMAFDGLGNRKSVTDPNGNTTLFEHDGLGRLVRTIDAPKKETVSSYDGEGLKLSETDRRGVRREFTYDNLGRPRRTSIAASISGVSWSQETGYDDRGRKRTEVDARGNATVSDLDGLNRVVRQTDPLGKAIVMKYDGVNKREETDKRGNTTKFDYDALNRLTRVTDPAPFEAQIQETTYEDALNRRVERDRRGIVRVTQMDPLGRVLTVTRAGIVLETNAYDANGNKSEAKDAEGKETRFTYDAANRLASRTDGFGTPAAATTSFRYDASGSLLEERDARAAELSEPFSVKNTYDELNRLTSTTDGEGNTTSYEYDEEGNRTLVREPEGQETRFAYDELGKLLSVTQPGSLVTSYAYDPNRNRTRQTDANGHVVAMEYDALNRMSSMTQDPGGLNLVTLHRYDENGNETEMTDPKGQVTRSIYDELNRLKSKSYAFASSDPVRPWRHTVSIAYTYDPNNNLTRIEESVASGTDPPSTTLTTIRAYDDLDRLTGEASPLPDGGTRTVSYTYFANGTRKTVTDPGGVETSYTYDGQNRLETATTAAGVTSYGYFPDDLLREVAYPNGVRATYGYDKADRLTSVANASGGTVISTYAYTYDRNGNRLSQLETNGGTTETTSYTYDALNRLRTVTYPADAGLPSGRKVEYGYDNVGNRTSEVTTDPGSGAILASKTGAFDAVNRLTLLTDNLDPTQTTSFTWDANGNQTSKTTGGVTTEYRYDTRNQMAETVEGASVLGRFQYDFEGRRTKKIGEEGTRQYVYDDTSTLLEYDGSGGQVAKYDWGSDRLISLFRRDEPRRFYSFDALGSVTNLTDDLGAAVASYHLDAWGNYRLPDELASSRNRFGFTGYLFDAETDLYYAKARFYDPEIGRFTTQDSVLGEISDPPSLHRYFYANDNPTRFVDPTGHIPVLLSEPRSYPNEKDESFLDFLKGGGKRALNLAGALAQYATDLVYGALFFDRHAAQRATGTTARIVTLGGVDPLVEGLSQGKGVAESLLEAGKEAGTNLLFLRQLRAAFGGEATAEEAGGAVFDLGLAWFGLNRAFKGRPASVAETGTTTEAFVAGETRSAATVEGSLTRAQSRTAAAKVGAEAGPSPTIAGASPGAEAGLLEATAPSRGAVPFGRDPVRPLKVGEFGSLKAREVVGDKLVHHEIPSKAAIRTALELRRGAPLSAAERRALQRGNIAVEIPGELHALQPTTGGRNIPAQILKDAADLAAAARRDLRAMVQTGLRYGFTRGELAEVVRLVRQLNRARGIK